MDHGACPANCKSAAFSITYYSVHNTISLSFSVKGACLIILKFSIQFLNIKYGLRETFQCS